LKRSLLAAALVLVGSLAGLAQTQNRFDDLIPRDKRAAPQQMSPEEQIKGLENTIGLLEQLSVMRIRRRFRPNWNASKPSASPSFASAYRKKRQ
jgi:hypothetical protein